MLKMIHCIEIRSVKVIQTKYNSEINKLLAIKEVTAKQYWIVPRNTISGGPKMYVSKSNIMPIKKTHHWIAND